MNIQIYRNTIVMVVVAFALIGCATPTRIQTSATNVEGEGVELNQGEEILLIPSTMQIEKYMDLKKNYDTQIALILDIDIVMEALATFLQEKGFAVAAIYRKDLAKLKTSEYEIVSGSQILQLLADKIDAHNQVIQVGTIVMPHPFRANESAANLSCIVSNKSDGKSATWKATVNIRNAPINIPTYKKVFNEIFPLIGKEANVAKAME